MTLHEAKQAALSAIHSDLRKLGTSGDIYQLPQPERWMFPEQPNIEPQPPQNLSLDDLNPEQRAAADAILGEMERGDTDS